jgi:hypothetical protein
VTPDERLQQDLVDLVDAYVARKLEQALAQERTNFARREMLAKLMTVTAKEQGKS